MKILICHNQYQQAGGEDSVVKAEMALLQEHGHSVQLYTVTNDTIVGSLSKIKAALTMRYSTQAKKDLSAKLTVFEPDVVHFHNTFPLLTASVYDACLERNIATVQTLHNFRFICPTALLLLNGRPCLKSLEQSAYWAVPHKVYKQSLVGTFLLANMIEYHKKKRTLQTKVDRFISLTQFSKDIFIRAGLPADKICVKPNFNAPKIGSTTDAPAKPFVLFVGRISPEKGLRCLMDAFNGSDVCVKVAGDGELFDELKTTAAGNIEFLGQLTGEDIQQLMQQASCLIMPSLWFEGFPMVIVEALSYGLPVVASNLGAMAEIIQDGQNGLLFETNNALELKNKTEALLLSADMQAELRRNAIHSYQTLYTAEKNYQTLINIYNDAISLHP